MSERPKHPSFYNRPKSSLQVMSQMAKFAVPDKDHAKKAHEAVQQQRELERQKEARESKFPAQAQQQQGRKQTGAGASRPQRVRLADYALNPNVDPMKRAPAPEPKEANRSLFSNCVTEVFAPLNEIKDEPYHSDRKVWPGATSSNRGNCLIGGDGSDSRWMSTAHSFSTQEWGGKDRATKKKNYDTRDPKNMVNPLTNEQFGWPDDVMAPRQKGQENKNITSLHQVALQDADEDDEDGYDEEYGEDYGGYDDGDEYSGYDDGEAGEYGDSVDAAGDYYYEDGDASGIYDQQGRTYYYDD